MTEKELVECSVCHKPEDKYWIDKYGMCYWCNYETQKKRQKEELKKETIETGESSNEDVIICPYCGYENDDCELHETTDTYCDECGKEFHLEVEWTASYSTSKISKERSVIA